MARREYEIKVRLNEEELSALNEYVSRSGLSRESYLRSLIKGDPIIERPPADYYEVLKNLRQINVNMNQIAARANTLGFINTKEYWKNIQSLQREIGQLKIEIDKY